jgi:hypothetical protein
MKTPVRYTDDIEQIAADEAETIESLNQTFDEILETTAEDYGHAVRAVHAKAHGITQGELRVAEGLPTELAQGLFAKPGRYAAVMRFSTNPGDILDDSIGLPRGLAIKLAEVEGERLPGSEAARTQDFVMVNGPAFLAKTPKQFLGNLKLLAKTTDEAEWAKKALSHVLRAAEAGLEAIGSESSALKSLGGAPNVHPLGETYYSQTAFRHGAFIAKYQLAPVSPDLTALNGRIIDTKGRPNAIREDMAEAMRSTDAVWELRVQLCRDLETMPVEDPSQVWDEAESPFVTVATLHAPAQASWDEATVDRVNESMRFSVWTGLAAHRPLGGVNRARKPAYEHSSAFRARVNGCPIHEPAATKLEAG